MPNHGFVSISKPTMRGSIMPRTNFALSAEVGGRWVLRPRLALYFGIYVDYGLRNIVPENIAVSLDLIKDYLPADIAGNEELVNVIEQELLQYSTQLAVPAVNYLSFGAKVRFSFGWDLLTLF
ncbi:hypothetical protein FACS189452_00320 [Bacteroidia bacterium]|nr:hypothetical protein FACS189452_00320 [Bacteroidia bacterium]GHT80350.1 hypothetical protein FACS189467_2290 [Bacteroidia bacterium]